MKIASNSEQKTQKARRETKKKNKKKLVSEKNR